MENLNDKMVYSHYSKLGTMLHRELRSSIDGRVSEVLVNKLLKKFWDDVDTKFNRLLTNQIKYGKY